MLEYDRISWCAGMSARSLELAKVGHYSRHEAAQEAAMAAAQVIKVKQLLGSLRWSLHQAALLTQVSRHQTVVLVNLDEIGTVWVEDIVLVLAQNA